MSMQPQSNLQNPKIIPYLLLASIPTPDKILDECSASELDLLMSKLLSAREHFLELNENDFRYWLLFYDSILRNSGSNLGEYVAMAKINRLIPLIESPSNAKLAASIFTMTLYGFQQYEKEVLSPLKIKRIQESETQTLSTKIKAAELEDSPLTEHVNYLMSALNSQALLIGHEIAKECIHYIKKIVSLTKGTENELIGWDFASSLLAYASGLVYLERDSPKLLGLDSNPKDYYFKIKETLQKLFDITELTIGLKDVIHPLFPQLLVAKLHEEYAGKDSVQAKFIEEQIELLGLDKYIDDVLGLVNREHAIFQEIRDQITRVIAPLFESKETPDLVPYMKEMYRPSEIARSFYKVRSINLPEIKAQMSYFKGFVNELASMFKNYNWDIFYPGSGSMLKGKCVMDSLLTTNSGCEATLHSIELSEGMRDLAAELAAKHEIGYVSHTNDLDTLTPEQYKSMGDDSSARITFIGGGLISNMRDPKSFISKFVYESDKPQVLVIEFDEAKMAVDYSYKRLMPIKFMQRFFGFPEEMLKTRDYITPEGVFEIYGQIDLVSSILPDKYHLKKDLNGQYIEIGIDSSNIKVYHGQEMKLIESRPYVPNDLAALMGSLGFKTSDNLISRNNNHVSMAFYKTSSSRS